MPRLVLAFGLIAMLISLLAVSTRADMALACPMLSIEARDREEPLIFVGTITHVERQTAYFGVEHYFRGFGPAELSVHWPIDTLGSPRQLLEARLLVFATEEAGGADHSTSGCYNEAVGEASITQIEARTGLGPGTLPQDAPPQEETGEEHKDTPWLIVLPLAFGIPLAVLLLPSFLSRRTQGH